MNDKSNLILLHDLMAVAALGGKCTGRQFSGVKLYQWALLQGTIFQGAICCGAIHQKGGGRGESPATSLNIIFSILYMLSFS